MFKLTNIIYRLLTRGEDNFTYKGITYRVNDKQTKLLRKIQLIYGIIPGIGLIIYFCLDRLLSLDLWISLIVYFLFTMLAITIYNILVVKLVFSKFTIIKENNK